MIRSFLAALILSLPFVMGSAHHAAELAPCTKCGAVHVAEIDWKPID